MEDLCCQFDGLDRSERREVFCTALRRGQVTKFNGRLQSESVLRLQAYHSPDDTSIPQVFEDFEGAGIRVRITLDC